MLQETLASVERQMLERLREIRTKYEHRGDKGANVEVAFREFLRDYLPRRLAVGHGEIVDTHGNRSGQTDVVIVNEDHPFTFTENDPGLFFVEGVSAVAEVKTILNTSHLKSAMFAAERFKKLRIRHARGTTIHTNESDRERFYNCPPCFLLAFESELTLHTIVDTFRSRWSDVEAKPFPGLDSVFVLSSGWAINFGDGKGAFRLQMQTGESYQGWAFHESGSALFDCLAWVSAVMPRIMRYDPIIASYMLPHQPPFPPVGKGD